MGRPTRYTPERAKALCRRLAAGESLLNICKDPKQPARATVYKWIHAQPEFVDTYALAREMYADYVFDGLLEICDNPKLASQDVQKAKLQIDTRKWCLARISPKKYSEKAMLEVTGADGGPLETIIYVDKALKDV